MIMISHKTTSSIAAQDFFKDILDQPVTTLRIRSLCSASGQGYVKRIEELLSCIEKGVIEITIIEHAGVVWISRISTVKNSSLKSEVVPFSFLDRFCKDDTKIHAIEALYLHYFVCQ